MKIAEFVAWMETVEPGEEDCAVKQSVQMCLTDAEAAVEMEAAILHLKDDDYTAYVLAVGHLIAVNGMNVAISSVALLKSEKNGAAAALLKN